MPLCSNDARLAAVILTLAACGLHEPLADTSAPLAARTIGFELAPPSLSLGFTPVGFVVADFDGDGQPEIATAGGSTGVILRYTPDAGLSRTSAFEVGSNVTGLVAGDLDGDGHVDLVVANHDGVAVLHGRGDGSFHPPRAFSVGMSTTKAIALGDFDRDGKLDIAAWKDSGEVSILLGCGDGTLRPARSFPASARAIHFCCGDIDGDGKLDLILIEKDSVFPIFGNGDGSFRTAPRVALVPAGNPNIVSYRSATAGDFNGDGKLDLALAYRMQGPDSTVGGVSIKLGNGDGSFTSGGSQRSSTGQDVRIWPASVAAGDLDGGGKLDVVSVDDRSDAVIASLGTGDGHLRTNSFHAVVAKSVAVADVDGDGKAEVLTVIDDHVTVLRSDGDGHLNAPRAYPFDGPVGRLAPGDFNGDGVPDVAVTYMGTVDAVQALLGNGRGDLHAAPGALLWGGSGLYADAAAVDLNGDGKLDFVSAENVSISLGNGDGTFQPTRSGVRGTTFSPLAAGDFDGDGALDLVVELLTNRFVAALLRGKGDGSFEDPRTIPVDSRMKAAVAADFDGDGRSDLVLSTDGGLFLLAGRRGGSFSPPTRLAGVASPAALAAADLDGNGTPDLVVAHADEPIATVLLDSGGGVFRVAGSIGAGGTIRVTGRLGTSGTIRVSDIDGDGIPDVAVLGASIALFRGHGDGTFEAAGSIDVGGTAVDFAFVDLDGDGLPELLVTPGWRSPTWSGWKPHYLMAVGNRTR